MITKNRHLRDNPCPLCGFWDDPRGRGRGTRCSGATFDGDDGNTYVICSQMESPRPSNSDGWTHMMGHRCDCGIEHGGKSDDVYEIGSTQPSHSSRLKMTKLSELIDKPEPIWKVLRDWYAETTLTYNGTEYRHMREDRVDESTGELAKDMKWFPAPSINGDHVEDFPLHQPKGQTLVNADTVVVITEGQKAANAVWASGTKALGLYGAKVQPTERVLNLHLNSIEHIILWADADKAGRDCMATLYRRIRAQFPAMRISIIENPNAKPKDDADDITTGEVAALIGKTVAAPEEKFGITKLEPSHNFPKPIDDFGFFGIPGDLVRMLSPYTEADDHAVYITIVTALGSLMGVNPRIEEVIGHPQLMTLVIGETAGGKGTSWNLAWNHVIRPVMVELNYIDEEIHDWLVMGVSSGEGIVNLFHCDPPEPPDDDEEFDPDAEPEEPCGSIQKFMVLTEAGTLLTHCKRPDSTTSTILRQMFDNQEHVQVPTGRAKVLRANDPHLTFLGQITREELKDELPRRWAKYGVTNRFLMVGMRASEQVLSIETATSVPDHDLSPIIKQLAAVIRRARSETRVKFDASGVEAFDAIRTEWKRFARDAANSFIAEASGRYTDQVGKLALILALLDPSNYEENLGGMQWERKLISGMHVTAAKQWADRSVNTIRWIWHEDELSLDESKVISYLENLETHQAMRSVILDDVFKNNRSKGDVTDVRDSLINKKYIEAVKDSQPQRKPVEIWKLIKFDE